MSESRNARSRITELDGHEGFTTLSNEEMEQVHGGARPCKDLNDTGCYSLVTLECR